jgi:eukaryotic-like serine/threonine-protein kinase
VVDPGAILGGRYRVGRALGKGGMATVVEAEHLQLGTKVAVKLLRDELASDPAIVERFLREARAAAALRGDRICRVLDFGTEGQTPYIVLELLEGRDLASVLDDCDALDVPLAASYVLQACEAVAELHSQDMVHRDLKPGNLFVVQRLDGSPLIKILDFGIAKATTVDFNLTSTASVMGSPAYMSPEQLRSSKNVDARSDIWSLGVVLFELVSGTKPFDADNVIELALSITNDEPLPLPRAVPTGFIHVIWKCLEKDPAARYQTVGELAAALQPFAGSQDNLAASVTRVLSAPRSSARPNPFKETTLGSASGVVVGTSARPLWIAIPVVLVIGGVLGVLMLWGGEPEKTVSPPPAPAVPAASTPQPPQSQPPQLPPAQVPPDAPAAVDAAAEPVATPVDAAPARPPKRHPPPRRGANSFDPNSRY